MACATTIRHSRLMRTLFHPPWSYLCTEEREGARAGREQAKQGEVAGRKVGRERTGRV